MNIIKRIMAKNTAAETRKVNNPRCYAVINGIIMPVL